MEEVPAWKRSRRGRGPGVEEVPALKGRAIRTGRPFGASDICGALEPQAPFVAVLSAEGASNPGSLPLQGQDGQGRVLD
jgi:hypothetical protein